MQHEQEKTKLNFSALLETPITQKIVINGYKKLVFPWYVHFKKENFCSFFYNGLKWHQINQQWQKKLCHSSMWLYAYVCVNNRSKHMLFWVADLLWLNI